MDYGKFREQKELELLVMGAEIGNRAPVLDLHGLTVEQSSAALETFLYSQFTAGTRVVKIVHGFGTGKLRKAVEGFLSENPLVEFWKRSERHGEQGAVVFAVLTARPA